MILMSEMTQSDVSANVMAEPSAGLSYAKDNKTTLNGWTNFLHHDDPNPVQHLAVSLMVP